MTRVDLEREASAGTAGAIICCEGRVRSLVFPGAVLPPDSGWCLACPAHWHGPDSQEIMDLHHKHTRHPTVVVPARDTPARTGR